MDTKLKIEPIKRSESSTSTGQNPEIFPNTEISQNSIKLEQSFSNEDKSSENRTTSEQSESRNKDVKRPSASKKYVGQVMVGIGHFGLKILENSNSLLDQDIKREINQYFLGKRAEDYKLSTLKKVWKHVIVDRKKDNPNEIKLKLALTNLIIKFFEDINYENWVITEFKGIEENKIWYLTNKKAIMDRILFAKKTHFTSPVSNKIASDPTIANSLTVRDNLFPNDVKLEQ